MVWNRPMAPEVCSARTMRKASRIRAKWTISGLVSHLDVHQRRLPVQLDGGRQPDGKGGDSQADADPWCLEPPVVSAEGEHHGQQAEAERDERIADEIQPVQHLGTRHRRQRQQVDDAERDQRQPDFQQVEAVPEADIQQRGGEQPCHHGRGGGTGQRHAQAPAHLPGRREGIQHVEEGEGRHGRGRRAGEEAHHHRRMQVEHEQVQQGDSDEDGDAEFGEAAQAELGAHLGQQDGQADIRRHVGRDQPGGLVQGSAQRALDLLGVDRDQVHSQSLRQP
jgi:hypothetical protein